jgi:translation elongation factor EF-Tu-like GTPase
LARIEAEVTFIPASEGGRANPPLLFSSGGSYRPHIVVGDPKQRKAIIVGNEIQETYLGVVFLSGPDAVEAGEPFLAELALIYYPHPAYDSLAPGATFTIREGPKVVGFGEVKKLLRPDDE